MKTRSFQPAAGQALGLLGLQAHAGGDDEHVVGQHRAVVEQHLVALDPDRLDLVLVEDDAVAQLAPARPHDLLDVREPEGDEEQARLVDVAVVAVDDVDLGLVGVEAAAQPVGGHRAAGAAAEDHDLLPAHDAPPVCHELAPAGRSRRSSVLDELDAGLDRAAKRTRAGDLLQALELRLAEVAAELDRDLEPARRRAVVVVDLDRHVAELPVLRPRVHDERRRDAGGERGREELVRRRSAAVAAEALRLVGDQAVLAVDHDLLPERAGDRAGCRGETHLSADSLLAARGHIIGAPAERRCGQLLSCVVVGTAPPSFRPCDRARGINRLATSARGLIHRLTRQGSPPRPGTMKAPTIEGPDDAVCDPTTRRINMGRLR